jgi:hypothetical protein
MLEEVATTNLAGVYTDLDIHHQYNFAEEPGDMGQWRNLKMIIHGIKMLYQNSYMLQNSQRIGNQTAHKA